jgi:hypothetical protein
MEKDIDTAAFIRFPWRHDNGNHDNRNEDCNKKPGEYILQTLFLEFCSVVRVRVKVRVRSAKIEVLLNTIGFYLQ